MSTSTSSKEFDLVLQGATGFTGRLAAEELALHAPVGLRWAVAGRDAGKLAALSERLGVPFVVADGLDAEAVGRLAQRARVVLCCAGPFTRYGTLLVDACVAHGTHYADLTGEVPWVLGMIERHHRACTEAGITLVPSSGFDSVPTDLGVLAMVDELAGGDASPPPPIHGFFSIRGGLNGGTLHSGIALGDDGALKEFRTPVRSGPRVFRVPSLGRWAAPFLMAAVNEWVVTRSAGLLEESGAGYGSEFLYDEHLLVRSWPKARTMAGLLSLSNAMLGSKFGRGLLRRFGPKPGEGPSERSIAEGFARLTLVAGDLEAPVCVRRWDWDGDPSNRITVRCLVQTGVALAAGEAKRGGVLTPASALGLGLLERLVATGATQGAKVAPLLAKR